jgi:transcription antitermination factor NusG
MADRALRHAGYESYLPVQKTHKKYSDRVTSIELALFPGYMFCRFPLRNRIRILNMPAVEYIVATSSGPRPLVDSEIDSVKRMIDAGALEVPYLTNGQRVRVECGPLATLEGVLVRRNSDHQLVISIELLRRSVSVRIDASQVCPI